MGFDSNCLWMAPTRISRGNEAMAREPATDMTFVILVNELRGMSPPSFSPTVWRRSMKGIG